MPMRLGPGPVFVYEWLTIARRWTTYAIRSVFVGAILVGLSLTSYAMVTYHLSGPVVSLRELALYGRVVYLTIAMIELALVLLAAPAATAGAVCLDKARGTLDHMLATDLSDAEIVLGKLGVRLIPVLGLIGCTLPVMAIVGMLGGVDPLAVVGSTLTAIGCALVGCALAMTLSIHGRKAHEVLIATYVLLIAWLIFPALVALAMNDLGPYPPPAVAPGFWQAVIDTNPYYLMGAPYLDPGKVGPSTFVAFLGGCLAASAGLVGLSTSRIRRLAMRQAGRPAAGRRRRRDGWPRLPEIPGPSLDRNPVAWREWHRMRPSRMMRAAWGLYAAFGLYWFVAGVVRPAKGGSALAEDMGAAVGLQVAVGLLFLSAGAATSLAEERARGSLDVLLSTPMATRSILAGKWWGAFRGVGPVAFWPALIGARLLVAGGSLLNYLLMLGSVLSQGAAIAGLGLTMATGVGRPGRAAGLCVAIYVAGSIGWLVAGGLMFGDHPLGRDLLVGCPGLGTFVGVAMMIPGRNDADWSAEYRGAAVFWMLAYVAVAWAMFALAVSIFDRRLGRSHEGVASTDGAFDDGTTSGRAGLHRGSSTRPIVGRSQ